MARRERVLQKIAEAFKDLADTTNSQTPYIEVDNLAEASKSIDTLESLLDLDIRNNCARSSNSHSRNIVRVKRSIDMVRIMFEQILAKGGNSIRVPVSMAYEQVFAPYHGWAIRTAVAASMYALPTKSQMLRKLNEDEASARDPMKDFVVASTSVVQYIDKLFLSRESGDELLGLI